MRKRVARHAFNAFYFQQDIEAYCKYNNFNDFFGHLDKNFRCSKEN